MIEKVTVIFPTEEEPNIVGLDFHVDPDECTMNEYRAAIDAALSALFQFKHVFAKENDAKEGEETQPVLEGD